LKVYSLRLKDRKWRAGARLGGTVRKCRMVAI